ncbi:MAG: 50S ribosomal protein L10, partial [bacterium]
MSRAEREKQIEVLHELFDDVGMGILVDFRGMTVSDLTSFRTQLRDQEATFKVVKNRLCIRAVEGTPFEAVVEHFAG